MNLLLLTACPALFLLGQSADPKELTVTLSDVDSTYGLNGYLIQNYSSVVIDLGGLDYAADVSTIIENPNATFFVLFNQTWYINSTRLPAFQVVYPKVTIDLSYNGNWDFVMLFRRWKIGEKPKDYSEYQMTRLHANQDARFNADVTIFGPYRPYYQGFTAVSNMSANCPPVSLYVGGLPSAAGKSKYRIYDFDSTNVGSFGTGMMGSNVFTYYVPMPCKASIIVKPNPAAEDETILFAFRRPSHGFMMTNPLQLTVSLNDVDSTYGLNGYLLQNYSSLVIDLGGLDYAADVSPIFDNQKATFFVIFNQTWYINSTDLVGHQTVDSSITIDFSKNQNWNFAILFRRWKKTEPTNGAVAITVFGGFHNWFQGFTGAKNMSANCPTATLYAGGIPSKAGESKYRVYDFSPSTLDSYAAGLIGSNVFTYYIPAPCQATFFADPSPLKENEPILFPLRRPAHGFFTNTGYLQMDGLQQNTYNQFSLGLYDDDAAEQNTSWDIEVVNFSPGTGADRSSLSFMADGCAYRVELLTENRNYTCHTNYYLIRYFAVDPTSQYLINYYSWIDGEPAPNPVFPPLLPKMPILANVDYEILGGAVYDHQHHDYESDDAHPYNREPELESDAEFVEVYPLSEDVRETVVLEEVDVERGESRQTTRSLYNPVQLRFGPTSTRLKSIFAAIFAFGVVGFIVYFSVAQFEQRNMMRY
ncbi:unnamed protein product, partial [Mesorhabditis spiculigera]